MELIEKARIAEFAFLEMRNERGRNCVNDIEIEFCCFSVIAEQMFFCTYICLMENKPFHFPILLAVDFVQVQIEMRFHVILFAFII